MAEVSQEKQTVGKKLFEIFSEGVNIFENIEKSSLPFNGNEFQKMIKKCVELFEDATRLVSLVGMFSANEIIEEIPTENLQFLLLPFYLGQLVQKLSNIDRETTLNTSRVYLSDFLKRCQDYEIIKNGRNVNKSEDGVCNERNQIDPMKELLEAANERNYKIEQYRKMKELENQISLLKLGAKKVHVDDEIKRQLYIQQLHLSIFKTKEDILNIDQEIKILEYSKSAMDHSNHCKTSNVPTRRPQNINRSTTSLKPIIITKDVAQKTVFGMGYPSLPVMSVAEFYEQRVKEGIFPNEEKTKQMNAVQSKHYSDENEKENEENEKAKQDELEEIDGDEHLARMRAKDEYKDVVRRGDGNRYNRS